MPYFLIGREAFALIWQCDINIFGKACWSATQGLAIYCFFYFFSSASCSKCFPPQHLQENPMAIPGQAREQKIPRSSPGSPPGWTCPKHLPGADTQEASWHEAWTNSAGFCGLWGVAAQLYWIGTQTDASLQQNKSYSLWKMYVHEWLMNLMTKPIKSSYFRYVTVHIR